MACLFCNIVDKTVPSTIVYEDTDIIAFNDITPQAPTHILIIPKQHIATLNDIQTDHAELLGQMLLTATHIAKEQGFADSGYRLVMNCNNDGGQTIYHIHLHLLGGRSMSWPPG